MSEERMIRVCEQGADLIYDLLATNAGFEAQLFMGNEIRWFKLEPVAPKDWVPGCHREWCDMTHEKRKPGHGPCCTCQSCGYDYDNCVCQYSEEPCASCPYRKKRE